MQASKLYLYRRKSALEEDKEGVREVTEKTINKISC